MSARRTEQTGTAPAASPRAEIERRFQGQRLTPAQRRIAQCLIERSAEIGFLSSMELAERAGVSQPSVTRFAVALGFDGFLDMRRKLRGGTEPAPALPEANANRYQAAAAAEAANVAGLSAALENTDLIRRFGQALAGSRPLPVVGLRAASGLATQFCYFAAKVHPDIRLIAEGGSMVEDQLDQARAGGAEWVLVFLMPLYPRETLRAMQFARQIGLRVALVGDSTFAGHGDLVDLALRARIHVGLVFDSYAGGAVLVSVLLDAMCDAMGPRAQARLDHNERSSTRRKVFVSEGRPPAREP